MACFLAPVAEAIVVSVVKKRIQKKEKLSLSDSYRDSSLKPEEQTGKIPFSKKLGWLSNMLWGGSFLLAIEHIWHGEVVPWPPFLTAMSNPSEIGPMLAEIATVGVAMAGLITAIWGIMVWVTGRLEKKTSKTAPSKTAEV
ncbi:MAG: hypothetical protein VB082_05730 [Christensenella sp.]|nr:hypothetical protein [Christensenella sp.]